MNFEIKDINDLDFILLDGGSANIYSSRELLEVDVGWLKEHSYSEIRINISNDGKYFSLQSIGRHFGLTGKSIGESFDEFSEYLYEVDIEADLKQVIVFEQSNNIIHENIDDFCKLLKILETHSQYRAMLGKRLIVCVESSDNSAGVSFHIRYTKFFKWRAMLGN